MTMTIKNLENQGVNIYKDDALNKIKQKQINFDLMPKKRQALIIKSAYKKGELTKDEAN